ncbi:MAG: hypothetical protein AAF725_16420, partial [Acidobacteriota bacterium]
MNAAPKHDTKAWRKHAGFIAWPTILFFTVVLAAWVSFALLAWQGRIGLGLTFVLQTVCAYLIFTPLHEASHGNVAGQNKRLRP